jgi:hypothetical protein
MQHPVPGRRQNADGRVLPRRRWLPPLSIRCVARLRRSRLSACVTLHELKAQNGSKPSASDKSCATVREQVPNNTSVGDIVIQHNNFQDDLASRRPRMHFPGPPSPRAARRRGTSCCARVSNTGWSAFLVLFRNSCIRWSTAGYASPSLVDKPGSDDGAGTPLATPVVDINDPAEIELPSDVLKDVVVARVSPSGRRSPGLRDSPRRG